MPYLYAHTLFGQDVTERLAPVLQARIRENRHAFMLGLLGPDIYFFDRLPPPLFRKHEKRTGNAIHNAAANDVFAALLALCGSDAAICAYTLGFLCHYALDGAAHPFVESAHRGLDHTRFEMEWELPLLGRRGETIVPPHRLFGAAMRDRRTVAAIDGVHTALTEKLFSKSVAGVYKRSCRNFLFVHRLLFDPNGKKRALLRRMERLLKKPDGTASRFLLSPYDPSRGDLFNEQHAVWVAHWDIETPRTESVFDLYAAAIDEAVALLPLCSAAIDGDRAAKATLLKRLEGSSMARGKTR